MAVITSSLLGKYRKKVLGETSAASAMSCTVVGGVATLEEELPCRLGDLPPGALLVPLRQASAHTSPVSPFRRPILPEIAPKWHTLPQWRSTSATERSPGHSMRTATGARLRDNPWLTLVSVTLGVIMVGIDGSVVAVANPYIGKDLHASLADLQWVTNAYLLVIAATADPRREAGRPLRTPPGLPDRGGRVLVDVRRHRARRDDRRRHPPPRGPRCVRRASAPEHPRPPEGGLPARGAQPCRRHLGQRLRRGHRRRADHRRDLRRADLVAERVLHQPAHRCGRPRGRGARPERDQGVGASALRHPRGAHPRPRGCWPSSTGWSTRRTGAGERRARSGSSPRDSSSSPSSCVIEPRSATLSYRSPSFACAPCR